MGSSGYGTSPRYGDQHSYLLISQDPEEEVTLVEAGFNFFSTHFILAARGSFTSFAEDMTPPERLKLVGPVVRKQAVVGHLPCADLPVEA
jgi:hypothetical protein